ncbi:hypothetical protein PVOR_05153 [Paenibacillus vortex V453]|jgi:hypothetical protein|uniref:Permease n=2 Tax=Paenibacillus TaxID=44249 RepID=A0A163JNR0_9BACL|nr:MULTISPECIES: hypothetical protein [Paenibacillus]ANA80671.1 hypothetical protein A3958_12130 [Paenibacillus glucanolyticus]AVV55258.1 hypothetical protein C7121_03375 [Paenibacillus glucanolyticus]AWP29844.1 hypothetical protein B9D94_25945 [Paenibacillus sp. Cedars]EFU43119.1 hypothetical protein PVOR_05153 [Paenibacillus vortex V453]ETT30869.1 hypothetical protein C169_26545 [Paenibacillus sp. FSL R5-808]
MKFRFKLWDLGSKLIFIATCLALASFFFKWLDIGVAAENGFLQGGAFFIVCFIYPFLKVVREKKMNKIIAYAFALAAIILTMMYVSSKTVDFFGQTIRGAAAGPYLFMVSCGLLSFGIFKRKY